MSSKSQSGASQPRLVLLGLVLVVLGAAIVAVGGVWLGERVADDVGGLHVTSTDEHSVDHQAMPRS